MEKTESRMAEVLALTHKRAEERRVRIAEIRKGTESWCLSQGFELSEQDLDDVAALTYRREALVGLMAKATPLGERWNEISKEIVGVECEIARVDSRLV